MTSVQKPEIGEWVLIEPSGHRGSVDALRGEELRVLFINGKRRWVPISDVVRLQDTISPPRPRKTR